MKKVMPFVQGVRDNVTKLGKIAFALTVDFNEFDILTTSSEYLKSTLELEQLEIKFTSDPEATEKMKEDVLPGRPFISYSVKPSVRITLENQIPRSGLFTQFLNVSDGDSTEVLKQKLAKALGMKTTTAIQLLKFDDHVLGPRKIPNFNDYKSGKSELESGIFSADVKENRVYITTESGKKLEIGTNLTYIIE
jgi:leucyl-tRNA synthetase